MRSRERLEDLAAFHDRRDGDAVERAAVVLGDDDVLRDVDEAPGQVAGVGRLQRRVGETLAGAVRRDEVLEDGEPLAEVRGDRRLDDLARRAWTSAAHAGELADLLLGASGAGVRHHVDGVELVRRPASDAFISLNISSDDRLGRPVPDVDDLVVPLAVRDGAWAALVLDLEDLLARALSMSSVFLAGIRMSSMPIEMPARVATVKPSSLTMSRISTVRSRPKSTKQ